MPVASLIIAIMLLIAGVIPAVAQAPRTTQAGEVVTTFHATLLDVMKRADALGVKGRFETLAPAVDKAFHLDLTARQSAGRRPWKNATRAEQTALLDVYDVLVRRGTTSISQLAKHISEFKSIVKNGLPALTDALREKTQALLGG